MQSRCVGGKRQTWGRSSAWLISPVPPTTLPCRCTCQLGVAGNAQKGWAAALESFIFDRTGPEKGQVPGRQINLMKFVIDHGNISLVIKAEINHKKLLIKTLAISLFPFPSFLWWWRSHSNCSQPFKIQSGFCVSDFKGLVQLLEDSKGPDVPSFAL